MNNNTILSFTFLWYYSRSGSTHFCNNIHGSCELIYATPEINIFWLCKSFIAFTSYKNFSLGLRYLWRSKLTRNLKPFEYQLFRNNMSLINFITISFQEYLTTLFSIFIQLKHGNSSMFHVIIKVSDINDFQSFYKYTKLLTPEDKTDTTKSISSFSHLFLARNPIYIHRSLISNAKFNYPFLGMGWRGQLYLIYKLSSILRFCKKAGIQIVDFDDFCQNYSSFIVGNQEVTYHHHKLQTYKQYIISNSETSIHTKATSLYQKPKAFQNQFSISHIFDEFNFVAIHLYIQLFPSLSYYRPRPSTYRSAIYIFVSLLYLPLILPFYLLNFMLSFLFQLIRDRYHANVFHCIL